MKIERINIKEFRELGFLQELNRKFLHPLGLALEIEIDDETGKEKLGGIWDYRNDPEGIIFDIKNSKQERIDEFKKKQLFIEQFAQSKSNSRNKILGYVVEPIP